MKHDLKALIEKRTKAAERRGLRQKAIIVATIMGTYRSLFDGHGIDGDEYTFKKEDITIIYSQLKEAIYGYVNIYVSDSLVLDDRGSRLCGYVPGKWEKKLNDLYSEAQKQIKRVAAREKEKIREQQIAEHALEKTKWGYKN